ASTASRPPSRRSAARTRTPRSSSSPGDSRAAGVPARPGRGSRANPMPELPEVEVTRQRIEPLLLGRPIAAVATTCPSYFFLTPPHRLRRALAGRRAEALERRGKYLVAQL